MSSSSSPAAGACAGAGGGAGAGAPASPAEKARGGGSNRVGKYVLGETLGEGAFGKVKLAVDASATGRGAEYAIKIMEKAHIEKNGLTLQVRREIAVMKAMRHPNIVNLHEVLNSSKKLYMVMDLVTGGELFDAVAAVGRLSETEARSYFQQLVDGVSYCHSRRVYHRDLKPENLLLSGDRKVLKITDFGLASIKAANAESELLHTVMGSPHYIAPEIITSAKEGYAGDKVDVWACGIILYGMLAGALPFDGDGTRELYRAIVHDSAVFPKNFSYDVIKLLRAMLHKNPAKRASMEEVKSYPWFKVDYEPAVVMPAPGEEEKEKEAAPRRRVRKREGKLGDGSSSSSSRANSSVSASGSSAPDRMSLRAKKALRSLTKQDPGNESSVSFGGSQRSARSVSGVSMSSDARTADVGRGESIEKRAVQTGSGEVGVEIGRRDSKDGGKTLWRKGSDDAGWSGAPPGPALGEIRGVVVGGQSRHASGEITTGRDLAGAPHSPPVIAGMKAMQREFSDTRSDKTVAESPSRGARQGSGGSGGVVAPRLRRSGDLMIRRLPSKSKNASAFGESSSTLSSAGASDRDTNSVAQGQRQRRPGISIKDMRALVSSRKLSNVGTPAAGSGGVHIGPKLRLKGSGHGAGMNRGSSMQPSPARSDPENIVEVKDVVQLFQTSPGCGRSASSGRRESFSTASGGSARPRRNPQPWVPVQRVAGIDSFDSSQVERNNMGDSSQTTPSTTKVELAPSNFIDRLDSKAGDIDGGMAKSLKGGRLPKSMSNSSIGVGPNKLLRRRSHTLDDLREPPVRLPSFNRQMSPLNVVAPTPALADGPAFADTLRFSEDSFANMYSDQAFNHTRAVDMIKSAERLYQLSDAVRNGLGSYAGDAEPGSDSFAVIDGQVLSPLTPEQNGTGPGENEQGLFGAQTSNVSSRANSRVKPFRQISNAGTLFKPVNRSGALSELIDSSIPDAGVHRIPSNRARSSTSSACSAEAANLTGSADGVNGTGASNPDEASGLQPAEEEDSYDAEGHEYGEEEDRLMEDNGAGGTWTMGVPQAVLEKIYKEDHDNGYPPWYSLDIDVFEDCDEAGTEDQSNCAYEGESSFMRRRPEKLKELLSIVAGGAPDFSNPASKLQTQTSADRPFKTSIFTALDTFLTKKLSGSGSEMGEAEG